MVGCRIIAYSARTPGIGRDRELQQAITISWMWMPCIFGRCREFVWKCFLHIVDVRGLARVMGAHLFNALFLFAGLVPWT